MPIPIAVLCQQLVVRNQALSIEGKYLAVGQPHLLRRFAIIRAVAIIGLMYPAAVRFGPLGVAVVIVFSNFTVLLMQVFKARKVIDLELSPYIRSYIPGLLLALPIIMIFDLLWLFEIDSPVLVLTIGTSALIAALIAGVFILNRPK